MKSDNSNNKTMIIVTVIILVLLLGVCFLVGNKGESSTSTEISEDADTIMANLQSESAAVTDDQKGEFGATINVGDYMNILNVEGEQV